MYPRGELREALHAARLDGLDIPDTMHEHDAVRLLERRRYLPRDRVRVAALVEARTRTARERVRVRAAEPEQLLLPWDGRLRPAEPEQVRLF